MARQLTAKGVERFKVKPGRAYTVWDAGAVGLGLKITPAGRRIWVLQLIFPGRRAQTKRTLAHYPAMGLKEARAQASLWYSWTKQGIDPKDKVAEAQRALALKRANTFASVAERYIEHIHRQRQRKAEVVERALRREFIAPWGPRLITDITKADVKAVIRATVNRGATYQ